MNRESNEYKRHTTSHWAIRAANWQTSLRVYTYVYRVNDHKLRHWAYHYIGYEGCQLLHDESILL